VSMHSGSVHTGDQLGRRTDGARQIPEATASRLLGYLRVLTEYSRARTASSRDLAAAAGVDAAKLRRDLSFLGSYGVRGVGYDVATLIDEISRALGAHTAHRVALVGVGNLGHALAGYSGFPRHGFELVALFDNDPQLIGTIAASLRVHDITDAATVIASERVSIGIIATPVDAAQPVADSLVEAGVRSILNFAPCQLELGDDVNMRQVDLGLELQMLAFHEARRPPGLAGPVSSERAVAR
jgi:redox-sensing transcriptional repressor